jgi:beta-glucanase (GH16 family)
MSFTSPIKIYREHYSRNLQSRFYNYLLINSYCQARIMVIISLFFHLIICNTLQAQICHGKQVILIENGKCDTSDWNLVFEDNFEGVALDSEKWVVQSGVVRDAYQTTSQQWFSPSNIQVNEGTLKILANKESLPNQSFSIWLDGRMQDFIHDFDYTSAEIYTRDFFQYGKIEIRCRIPSGKGFWPAFWLYGEEAGINNEIDIFEFWDNSTRRHKMTIHYNGQMCLSQYIGPDYSNGFHVFSLIWDNYKIAWYVDGDLKRSSSKFYSVSGQALDCNSLKAFQEYILNTTFPRSPMNIIVGLGIQNGKYSPDDKTRFPNQLEVDYVRIYQKK